MECLLCNNSNNKIIYEGADGESITSLAKNIGGKTITRFCKNCKHIFTDPLNNLDEYYSENYNILNNSQEEDQLYISEDGTKEFRLPYQARIFDRKIKLEDGDIVLDYGCAKSSTLRLLSQAHPKIIPACFDVSESYLSFWEEFVDKKYQFTKSRVPEALNGKISCVTSFFSLEHTCKPREFMSDIRRLLKDGGKLLCIIPNVFKNWADLVVADHVNHFTIPSIKYLMALTGFRILDIDTKIYNAAYVVVAEKIEKDLSLNIRSDDTVDDELNEISNYWNNFSKKVSEINKVVQNQKYMIYGAGFYGGLLATKISSKPSYFLDLNPHLHGSLFFGSEVISPANAPDKIDKVIVGLNPLNAKKSIAATTFNNKENYNFIFLD